MACACVYVTVLYSITSSLLKLFVSYVAMHLHPHTYVSMYLGAVMV